jgi:hypothetical protein
VDKRIFSPLLLFGSLSALPLMSNNKGWGSFNFKKFSFYSFKIQENSLSCFIFHLVPKIQSKILKVSFPCSFLFVWILNTKIVYKVPKRVNWNFLSILASIFNFLCSSFHFVSSSFSLSHFKVWAQNFFSLAPTGVY